MSQYGGTLSTAKVRQVRPARPWRQRDGLFRAVFVLLQAAFLGTTMLVVPAGVLAAAPSANLDQCANDPAPSSPANGCATSASDWVNGNLNASKSVFLEGDSIPYRMLFDSLDTSISHTVTIEWDTTKSSKHAIDYVTTWNRSVLDANPCLGVSGCSLGGGTTFPIPADPQVTGAGVTPAAGNFTIFGGTVTGVSAYSYLGGSGFSGDKEASISITFTASVANPVLAWGGHIASRADWGNNNSAVAITGSPYHTRLLDLDGSGGNQDRSLKEDAVIFPGSITIIKDATPNGTTSFGFTAAPAPLANFSLVDDGTSANTKVFSTITSFTTYTVAETLPGGWQLDNRACQVTSANGGSTNTGTPTNGVTINLKEGENVTCTFSNSETPNPSLNVTKEAAESSVDSAGDVIHYTIVVSNTGNTALTGVSVNDPLLTNEDCDGTPGAPFTNSGLSIPKGGSLTCTGTYTVTQADIDNNGGGDGDIDNTVTADSNETGPDTASAVVPIAYGPALNVTKTAAEASVNAAGNVIHYTITVFNTGNVTLTGVSVNDPLLTNEDCDGSAGAPFVNSGFTINVGGSLSCSGSYAVTQADIDNNGGGDGDIDNTVTADSNETGPDTASAAVPIVYGPALNVTKVAAEASVSAAGNVIHYTITVFNTGNVTLTGVSIDDPLLSNEDCDGVPGAPFTSSGFTIIVGGSLSCTGTYTVTQADLDNNGGGDGDIDNTVTADSNETGPDTASAAVPIVYGPALSVTKTVVSVGGDNQAPFLVDAPGDLITYSISVFNTGNVTLTGVLVNDPLLSNEDCDGVAGAPFVHTGFTINVGGSLTCTGSYAVTQADLDNNGGGDGDIDNVVTADSNETGPDTDTASVPLEHNPALSIDKVDNTGTFDAVNDVISYTIKAKNTGNVTLTNVAVTDAQVSDLDCDAGTPGNQTSGFTLAPGAELTCSASHTIVQADLDAGSFWNQACVDDGQGGAAGQCDDVTTPGSKNPALSIDKVDNTGTFDAVNDVISYTIKAKNTGNVTLTNVAVTDAQVSDLDCDAGTPGNQTSGFTLAPGAELTCSASHTIVQADLDAGSFWNQACVDDGQGGAAGQCDDVTTNGDQNPALSITKVDDGETFSQVGDVIDYTIVAKNTGNVTLHDVGVTDLQADLGSLDCTPSLPVADLAPDAEIHCSASHEVTQDDIDAGSYRNAACVDDGQGPATEVCADVTTEGEQNPELSITKDATEETYNEIGDVIHYTITAWNSGNVTLHDVLITDPNVDPALLLCTPENPVAELEPGDSIVCTATHTIDQGDLDSGSVFNKACVDDTEGPAPEVCADVTTEGEQNPALSIDKQVTEAGFDKVGQVLHYTIKATNTGNVTLHDVVVTDPLVSDLECTPELPVADLAPGASIECTATHTVVLADFDTLLVFNKACVDDGQGGAAEACDEVSSPGQKLQDKTDIPTEPNTATIGQGAPGAPADGAWLLIVGLAIALGAFVVLRPGRSRKRQ